MLITIIGGRLEDAERLSTIGAAAGYSFEIRQKFLTAVGLDSGSAAAMLDIWEARVELEQQGDKQALRKPVALVFETPGQPELAVSALRAVRKEPHFDAAFAIMAVTLDQVGQIEPSGGFDDFVLHPYGLDELYSRVRVLLWRRSERSEPKYFQAGGLFVDRAGHEVLVDGRPVRLTTREFALLSYLCERPGKVLSREHLLARVWGRQYAGGHRTVDIHVRRLRAKLGPALPIDTLRGTGYKLRVEKNEPRAPLESEVRERKSA